MRSRFILAVWTLKTCGLHVAWADSVLQDNQDVIIGASVAVTLVIVIIIICVGYFCYSKAVKKIRTKIRMRELISCKYRSHMMIRPETPVTIDNYFIKEGLDVDKLFTAAVEKSVDTVQLVESGQDFKGFDADQILMKENERQQMGDILHAPNKVKRLYEQQDMVTPDTCSEATVIEDETENIGKEDKETTIEIISNDTSESSYELKIETSLHTSSELNMKDVKDGKSFKERYFASKSIHQPEELFKQRAEIEENEGRDTMNFKGQDEIEPVAESEAKEIDDDDNQSKLKDSSSFGEIGFKETSRSTSPTTSESYQRKTPFLSLPEINQFFDLTNTNKKRTGNKNRQNNFRKSNKKPHMRTSLTSNYPLAIANINKMLKEKNRSKANIVKELKLFSSQMLVSQRLKRHNLLFSRVSLPHTYTPEKAARINMKKGKKKMPIPHSSPNPSPRNCNFSRASGYRSNRSKSFVSVSDIGIGLR